MQIIQKTAEMIEVAKEKQPHKKYHISIWKCPCLEMEAVSQYLSRNDTGCPKNSSWQNPGAKQCLTTD